MAADLRAPQTPDLRLVRAVATRARSRSARVAWRSIRERYALPRPRLRTGEEARAEIRADLGGAHLLLALRPVIRAPHHARHALVKQFGAHLPADVLADAELLTTELVTNAVVHGGDGAGKVIRLAASVRPGTVVVRVIDQGPGFDPLRARRTPGPDGGWGLGLVEELSSRWGVVRHSTGSSVWFRLWF